MIFLNINSNFISYGYDGEFFIQSLKTSGYKKNIFFVGGGVIINTSGCGSPFLKRKKMTIK